MSHPLHHAQSAARRFGGEPEDYIALQSWLDGSKEHMAFFTHRALRHHSQGAFEAERVFGVAIKNSAGREIPTRVLAERHIMEDCRGRIPSMADWFSQIKPAVWMANGHIDNTINPIIGDPVAAWRDAVALQQTNLGLKEWQSMKSMEQDAA